METVEVEQITYLEPLVDEFSQYMFKLVDLTGEQGIKHTYVYQVCVCLDEVMNCELAVSGMKNVDRSKTDFVFVEGYEFIIVKIGR